MSWLPVAKNAVTIAAKYAPRAKDAWDVAGKPVQRAAKSQYEKSSNRRGAFDEARTVRAGSVLGRIWEGRTYWLVFSGDLALSAYPSPPVPLHDLVENANLANRQTPHEYDEARLRAKSARVAKSVAKAGSAAGAAAGRSTVQRVKRLPHRKPPTGESEAGS